MGAFVGRTRCIVLLCLVERMKSEAKEMHRMNRNGRRSFVVLALAAMLVGLVSSPGLAQKKKSMPAEESRAIVAFAAASLKTALDEIAAAFKKDTGNELTITYASSAVLAKQIEQGAPADIFISADIPWMDYVEKANLLKPLTRKNLLGNKLVLIEPVDNKTKLTIEKGFDLAGAIGDGKLAVCSVASCPAGVYAKESLQNLGIWEAVEPKLAQAENVRAALALVARAEAGFGIVYLTDYKAEPKVRLVGTFPESSHKPIVYPVALLASSTNPAAPKAISFLSSQAATKILTAQGFTILSK
jgi:molybdate transport system substrate-binding protein